jgi:hypothetical protein
MIAVDAVLPRHAALRLEIGEKRKVELAVLRKREMAPNAIDGNAEQLGVEAPELAEQLVVERHLIAAHRAPVRGIERDDHRPAAELADRHSLIGC